MKRGGLMILAIAASTLHCAGESTFDTTEPWRGPGELVGNGEPVSDGDFTGGSDPWPAARAGASPPSGTTTPDCGEECERYCDGLRLSNPLNEGACSSLWGAGLTTQPYRPVEACRRMFADLIGRYPTGDELETTCLEEPATIAATLINSDAFVDRQRRHYADLFLYNSQVTSVERIYDMDLLVEKTHRGRVGWDQFAQVVSAHPVLMRRYNTAGDIAESVFRLFWGRPPFAYERADLARLYRPWANGYVNNLALNMRLPDSFISYGCSASGDYSDEYGGDGCVSTLFGGVHRLELTQDWRAGATDYADSAAMWSGLLSADEWVQLQLPGRLITSHPRFWEVTVDATLERYFEYSLGAELPRLRDSLIRYLATYQGDIRALHFAIVTSALYLQSNRGDTSSGHRFTYGPFKQADAKVWLDSLAQTSDIDIGGCDHRLTRPDDFISAKSLSAYRLLRDSQWPLSDQGGVDQRYANMAQTLGGCSDNETAGAFKIISVLSTSTQSDLVAKVCAPTEQSERTWPAPAQAASLLPSDLAADASVTPQSGARIFSHLSETFLGRSPSEEERLDVETLANACSRSGCDAESFARVSCYALLSSSEYLFY